MVHECANCRRYKPPSRVLGPTAKGRGRCKLRLPSPYPHATAAFWPWVWADDDCGAWKKVKGRG